MGNDNGYRPRLSAELREDQGERFFTILPHGWQKPLFQVIVDGVIELYDRGGVEAVGAIVSKHLQLKHVVNAGLDKSKEDAIKNLEKKLEELKETTP